MFVCILSGHMVYYIILVYILSVSFLLFFLLRFSPGAATKRSSTALCPTRFPTPCRQKWLPQLSPIFFTKWTSRENWTFVIAGDDHHATAGFSGNSIRRGVASGFSRPKILRSAYIPHVLHGCQLASNYNTIIASGFGVCNWFHLFWCFIDEKKKWNANKQVRSTKEDATPTSSKGSRKDSFYNLYNTYIFFTRQLFWSI